MQLIHKEKISRAFQQTLRAGTFDLVNQVVRESGYLSGDLIVVPRTVHELDDNILEVYVKPIAERTAGQRYWESLIGQGWGRDYETN